MPVDSKQSQFQIAWLLAVCLGSFVATGLFSMLQTAPAAESKVDQKQFQTQVAPLLEKHCVSCHGPEEPESGFRLDTKAHLLPGGVFGRICFLCPAAPGRLAWSLCIRKNMPKNDIIAAAREARRTHWVQTSDVSAATRAATAVTVAWQDSVRSNTVETEVPIRPGANDAIDVVELPIAYELKVSGNNPHHEFYKDIFKVVAYNDVHATKIEELVFMTDAVGASRLLQGLGGVAATATTRLGFSVDIVDVNANAT